MLTLHLWRMKAFEQGQISRQREITELEAEAFKLAHEVRIARLTGQPEEGINYLCDSKLRTMNDKTKELLNPLKQ